MDENHIAVLKKLVEHGGGNWVGRQEAEPDDSVHAHVLFQAPMSGKLLMLPDDEFFTVQAVQAKIHLADKRYDTLGNYRFEGEE